MNRFFTRSAQRLTSSKKIIVPLILFIVVLLIGSVLISSNSSKQNTSTTNNEALTAAKKTAEINREFQFPIKDEKGKDISTMKYVIESVELRDEIVVKGQKATSLAGRTFLLVNIRITNDLDKKLTINTTDYVRLLRNGNPEQLAPDIHNDPVEVQAISTKYTRLGFPINNSDADLQLQIGEIKGNKETVAIQFN